MIFKEDEIIYENENTRYNYLNEEKALTEEDFKRDYKNFDEFCKTFNRVEDAMYWYKYNDIQWPSDDNVDDPNNRAFSWPNDILKTKIGNCWDHSIFFYYFCKKHNIPARMYRYVIFAEPYIDDIYWAMGHCVCFCKLESGYYVCNYGIDPTSNLYGPFKSFEECEKSYAKWYSYTVSIMIKKSNSDIKIKSCTKTFYAYVDNNDLKLYDKYYGNHNITQLEFDKLEKSTKFKYDNRSIKRNIFDELMNNITFRIKSFFSRF